MKITYPLKQVGEYFVAIDEKATIIANDWYIDDINEIRQSVVIDAAYWSSRKNYHKVIAIQSTHPRAKESGLPTFEIEDEVEKLAKEYVESDVKKNQLYFQFTDTFNAGYKAAQEKFKELEIFINQISETSLRRKDDEYFKEEYVSCQAILSKIQSLKQVPEAIKIELEQNERISDFECPTGILGYWTYKPKVNSQNQLIDYKIIY